eukprot:6213629-Pleurochrysis_carterae.AAC.1
MRGRLSSDVDRVRTKRYRQSLYPSEPSSIGSGFLIAWGLGSLGVRTRRSGPCRTLLLPSFRRQILRPAGSRGVVSDLTRRGGSAFTSSRVSGLRGPYQKIRVNDHPFHNRAGKPVQMVRVVIRVQARRLKLLGWQPFSALPGWGVVVFEPEVGIRGTRHRWTKRSGCIALSVCYSYPIDHACAEVIGGDRKWNE